MTLQNADEILDYAIDREQEAHDFYIDLAEKVDQPGMKDLFKEFAAVEMGHKNTLESIKKGKTLLKSSEKVLDLKIAEYVVDVDPNEELDYQKALILAMKREKAAFRLYLDLARSTDDPEVKKTFEALANEEAKHKLRFEIEYDDVILAEN
jgi:rubrerythrin